MAEEKQKQKKPQQTKMMMSVKKLYMIWSYIFRLQI